MAMDLSAESLVRASSGLLFVALGVFIALATRKASNRWLTAGLAAFCSGFGASFVIYNLASDNRDQAPLIFALHAVCWTTALLGLLIVLAGLRPNKARRIAHSVALTLAFGGTLLFVATTGTALMRAIGIPPAAQSVYSVSVFSQTLSMFAAFLVAVELALQSMTDTGRGKHLLAVGVAGYYSYHLGEGILVAAEIVPWYYFAFEAVFLAAALAAWLRACAGPRGRGASWVLLALLALCLLGMLSTLIPFNEQLEDRGQVGIVRIALAVVVVVAVLRHDALGTGFAVRSVRRGTLATAALAALFIVAQVAQNFFAAKYGLLMGGVVAGTVVFAASPIQRAFERMGGRESGPAPSRGRNETKVTGARQEAAFRDAVRLAWRDRRFDDQEELALMRLADVIGLPAERAAAIRQEVQNEKGVR